MAEKHNHSTAIIFDFGGVLIDWSPHYLYDQLLPNRQETERFLAEVDFYAWNLEQDAGRSWAEAVAAHCARHPEWAEMIRAYDARWAESMSGPIAGTVAILEELKAAGYPLFGLSNWSAEKFRLAREMFPFFRLFEDIVVSGEVKLVKPDPRIFRLTLERIGRQAGECLLIDDSAANIETARSLGFGTIHFRSPEALADELEARGLLNGRRGYASPACYLDEFEKGDRG